MSEHTASIVERVRLHVEATKRANRRLVTLDVDDLAEVLELIEREQPKWGAA